MSFDDPVKLELPSGPPFRSRTSLLPWPTELLSLLTCAIGIMGASGVVTTVAVADSGGGRSGVSSRDSRVLECGNVAMAGSSTGSWFAFLERGLYCSAASEICLNHLQLT